MTRIVLAFDYGLRAIGIAVGNNLTRTARPLDPLPARDGVPDWERVRRLLDEWHPEQLVVGLPLNMDGSASEMSARAERFARRLQGRFGIACAMMDERLSSFEAQGLLGPGASRGDAHGIAASLVLESWFAAESP